MSGIADPRLAKALADRDLYGELGARPGAHLADLQSAYRRAALTAHPDKGGSAAAFQRLTAAFEVLSCPATRELYIREREQKPRFGCVSSKKVCGTPRQSGPKPVGPNSGSRQKRKHANIGYMARKRALHRATKVAKDKSLRRAAVIHLAGILKSVRQVNSTRLKQMLDDMKPRVKEAIFTYMKTHQATVASKVESGRTSSIMTEERSFYWGTSIRTIRHAKAPRYQAQLRMRHLRIQTRVQMEMESALYHQTGLIHACTALTAAGVDIWNDADCFCSIFEARLHEIGLSLGDLGLSAHIFMRADDMFCRPAVITSSVMSLNAAVAEHSKLCRVRRESWESLRAAWVPLMRSTRHAQRRSLSESEAVAIADRARLGLLERHFARALRVAERLLDFGHSKRVAGEGKQEIRAHKRPFGREAQVVRNVCRCTGECSEIVHEVPPGWGGA